MKWRHRTANQKRLRRARDGINCSIFAPMVQLHLVIKSSRLGGSNVGAHSSKDRRFEIGFIVNLFVGSYNLTGGGGGNLLALKLPL